MNLAAFLITKQFSMLCADMTIEFNLPLQTKHTMDVITKDVRQTVLKRKK